MNYAYLSQSWAEQAAKRVREELTPEDMKKVSSSMMNIYEKCPDGKTHYFYVKFEEGVLTDFYVGTEGDPVADMKAEFNIIGDYEIFAQISRAELGARSALMRNKIKLKGNMIKALRLASVVDRFNKILSTIPTDY